MANKQPIYVDDLGIAIKTQRVLAQSKILYTTDLLRMSCAEVAALYGVGPTTLNDIKNALNAHGLALAEMAA